MLEINILEHGFRIARFTWPIVALIQGSGCAYSLCCHVHWYVLDLGNLFAVIEFAY